MRLHRLEATAFGPFAETVEVDFDALSDAGLFLLSGATGAGKTSVLDAVSFALYGDVPGDRAKARRYRSDGAADGLAPRVVLELSLSGRRFRCTRSPAWQRPKRRGSGLTTQQASVLVEERRNGAWESLTTRLDEAGHLVTDLVGMNLPQFCQVAMLPQGRFQAFLRARSEERHHLLQQLFSTQRYEDIERWLREHARGLHRASDEHARGVTRLLSRLVEAGAPPLPEDWEGELTAVAGDGTLLEWARTAAGTATDVADGAARVLAEADAAERRAAAEAERATVLVDQQHRHAQARLRLERLHADRADHDDRRHRLHLARRAAAVVPLHRLAVEADRRRDEATGPATEAVAAAAADLGVADPSDQLLADAAAEAQATRTAAELMLPREQAVDALTALIADDEAAERDAQRQEAELGRELEALPGRLQQATAARAAAGDAGTLATRLVREVEELSGRLAAHASLTSVRADLAAAQERRSAAVAVCQQLREAWLDLREARINGMAAELALDLAVGSHCPVCGSADHPHKASPAAGAPTPEAERDARRRLDDAELTRTALDGRVHELGTTIAVLERDAAGGSPEQLTREHDRLAAALEAAEQEAEGRGALEAEVAALTDELAGTRQRLAEVRSHRSGLAARLAGRREEHGRTRAEVDALLGDRHRTLRAVIEDSAARTALHREAHRRRQELAEATRAADQARRVLADCVAEHGFETPRAALAAVLDESSLAELEQAVLEHERQLDQARAVVEDPALAEAATRPAPDAEGLTAVHARARHEHAAAHARHQAATTRSTRLQELGAELTGALAAWEPVRAAYRTAAGLAAVAEGTSADNEWRMRLSGYVLAWRLGQVVAAANERLLRMSDRRYALEHSGRRGAGETRGGLSLLVRDEWSGEARDPATLSGGETFVVSLALALGLADVVTHESGGAELDTLFVDEGFGSLDPDTLDDVMDVLDTLRDGGRVVGVVSHVTELRTRIPVQLAVRKQRTGSTLAVRHAIS
ncbi:AAA family ATPase [Nocardioides donggukensis]|uniref:Nuclease SbcCD subunit C n=1 Tax=Nocardioides donggukensis TaxID=2774019 RepID=A0A927K4A2_9ACTN|nr:AAA family ATPase [Nocardioides donggukensis]MBD8869571.1 AAA family ATPase [Nocardioides donggukensis]